jgi:hypothetical protein
MAFLCAFVSAESAVFQALEPLRLASSLAANLDIVTRFIVLVFSLAILVIAALAYKKTKSTKLLFVGLAFLLFAVKWLLKVVDLYLSPGTFFPDASENVFELFILVSLFIAIFRKK